MIRYLPAADESLADHAAYIGARNPAAATRFLVAVRRAVDGLAMSPRMGPELEAEEPRLFGTRWLKIPGFKHHRAVYRIVGADIEVLQIFHTSQNPKRLRDV